MIAKKHYKQPFKVKQPRYDKNEFIRANELMVIDNDGEKLGKMSRDEALELARSKDLDLVLIAPNQEPPVAKVIDWSKFKYIQNKKNKNKGKSVKVKEWWFKPKIEIRDIENKLKNVEKFLQKTGGKVKVTIKYKRRTSPEDLKNTMDKVLEMSQEFSEVISDINKEGRNLSVFLKYKKNEKK